MISPLRLVFMGTPEFAVPTLQALLESEHQVLAVYSQPPKPAGRGHHIQKSPVHLLAEARGIPVLTPETLNTEESQQELAGLNPDVCIVVAYGLILPKGILAIPRLGCLNVHASLLPRWRGASPIQRAILEGDAQTGISIMKMDEGLDTGPILAQEILPLTKTITASNLHHDLAFLGAQLLLPILGSYAVGTLAPQKQSSEGVAYAHKLTHGDGSLNWKNSADRLERQVRALNPWPGAWFIYQDQRLKVLEACVVDKPSAKPGLILDDHLTIACGKNALQILTIQRPGKTPLAAEEFLRGFTLSAGTELPIQ